MSPFDRRASRRGQVEGVGLSGAALAVVVVLLMLSGGCQGTAALRQPQATIGPAGGSATATVPTYLPLVEKASESPTPAPRTPTPPATPSPMPTATPGATEFYTYRVVNTYPHDPEAFTQGLTYDGASGTLYEGTGLYGRSSLREVELETGEVLRSRALPAEYFGEGITSYDDKIFQLTWRSNIGFVWSKAAFEQLDDFTYPTEGWGITHDEQRFIMSDGSATLHFWDPQTLEEIGSVEVHAAGQPVGRLNELEYIRGSVYANIWVTDQIVRIDPATGQITAWIDLTGLLTPQERTESDVLNGIAYDAAGDRLFVTGKLWPKLFEIKLIPTSG